MTASDLPTALLLFAYDSQLKWAHALGGELAARGWQCAYAVPSDLRSFVADEQADALGVTIARTPWDDLLDAALDADAVVLALQGPVASRFVQELVVRASERDVELPVVVTGWVGVIIEKIVAGYLERFASDVVAVSSRADLRVFTETAAMLDLPTDNLLLSGLPLLPSRPAPARRDPLRTVLFADQPTVPSSRADRAYVYDRLVEHARRHPERRVLLKPRHRPGEDTFHVMRHHPEQLLGGRDLPPNFEIVYEPISDLLPTVDLLLTVSSTAGLESVGAGVRTAFVGDLGVHENLGNHVLLSSGLVRTFDAVDAAGPAGEGLPEPRGEWVDDYFVGSAVDVRTPAQRVVDRVVELVAVPAADRPLAHAVDTGYYRGRVEVAAYRAASGPELRVRRSVRTVRWNSGVRGRVLLACHAVLPAGWEDWGWVERMRTR
jgi:hypothetical protein